MTKEEILEWIKNFKLIDSKEEIRIPTANKDGGIENNNKNSINIIRGVGKYMLGQIGRKILSGDFKLSTISFPIKAMISKSQL